MTSTAYRQVGSARGLWTSGVVTSLAAAVVNTVVFLIAQALDVGFEVAGAPGQPAMELTWPIIAGFSFGSGLVATVVAWLLNGRAPRARALFVGLATLGLLLSFAPFPTQDLDAQELAVAGLVVLGVLHVVVYAFVVPPLTRQLASR